MMSAELQSGVRKLRWLSLATAIILFAMLAAGLATAIVRFSLFLSDDTFADQTAATGQATFTLTMLMVGFIDLLCFGVPGALMLMTYRQASDSLRTQTLQSLVPTIAWLRRFLMCGVLLLLALLGFMALISLLDLGRYLSG